MILRRFENPEEFYPLVELFLMESEAEHNLILSFRSTFKHTPDRYPNPYLAFVEEDGTIQAVIAMTPPGNVILSHIKALEAMPLVAHDLWEQHQTLPGIEGGASASKYFAEQWQALSGQPFRLELVERIYQLEAVNPVSGVPGNLRLATDADYELLVEWVYGFEMDAFGYSDRAKIETYLTRLLQAQVKGLYLWEVDGVPVSMGAYGNFTPNGGRISAVYTPREYRQKGYASAAVAGLSQMVLDRGLKYCFLFTDVANATANHIYQQIGYHAVCEFDRYKFDPR